MKNIFNAYKIELRKKSENQKFYNNNNFDEDINPKRLEEIRNYISLVLSRPYFQNNKIKTDFYYKLIFFLNNDTTSKQFFFKKKYEKAIFLIEAIDPKLTALKMKKLTKDSKTFEKLFFRSYGFYNESFLEIEKQYSERLNRMGNKEFFEEKKINLS